MIKIPCALLILVTMAMGSCRSACEVEGRKNSVTTDEVILNATVSRGKVELVLVNGTANPIKINRIFTLGHRETSIHFSVAQTGARRQEMTGAIPQILDPQTLQATVAPGGIYGMLYEASDLQQLYGLQKGCHVLYASYENPINDGSYTNLEISSNKFQVCISTN
jgi:hypothetical protein